MIKRKKIAVLMVGHIKNSITNNNHKNIINNLLLYNDCDMFVYTSKYYSFRCIDKNNKIEVDLEKFYDIYKKYIKKIIVEEYENKLEEINNKLICNIIKKYKQLRNNKINFPISPIIIKQAFINDIKNIYAKENNIEYDYVLLIRPDNEIFNIIDFNKLKLEKNTLYYSEWYSFGDTKTMNIYCDKIIYFFDYIFDTNSSLLYYINIVKKKSINTILNNEYITVLLPYNSYQYCSFDITKKEKELINKHSYDRIFLVKDYKEKNNKNNFYKNYIVISKDVIDYICNKYIDLLSII